jgi:hypothetical protein
MICEATVPVTGRRCGETASITIVRFGGPFHLCAACALREQQMWNWWPHALLPNKGET